MADAEVPGLTSLAPQAAPGDLAHHYSGDRSRVFWNRVAALPDERRDVVYGLGVALQNLEEQVLHALTDTPTGGSDEAHPSLSGSAEAGSGQAEVHAPVRGDGSMEAEALEPDNERRPAPVASSVPVTAETTTNEDDHGIQRTTEVALGSHGGVVTHSSSYDRLMQIVECERDRARRRASVFRAQGEPTHAFGCDSIAVVLSSILSQSEQSVPHASASVGEQTADPQDSKAPSVTAETVRLGLECVSQQFGADRVGKQRIEAALDLIASLTRQQQEAERLDGALTDAYTQIAAHEQVRSALRAELSKAEQEIVTLRQQVKALEVQCEALYGKALVEADETIASLRQQLAEATRPETRGE